MLPSARQGAVFHVAAKPGVWGDYADYFDANVKATMNVIRACRELGIPKLIYTSSPSVTDAAGRAGRPGLSHLQPGTE